MKKKIALVGAHASGKTDLSEKLKLAFKFRGKTMSLVHNVSPDLNGGKHLFDADFLDKIIEKQIGEELRLGSVRDLICEGAILSNYVYSRESRRTYDVNADLRDYSGFEKRIKDQMSTYSLILKLDLGENSDELAEKMDLDLVNLLEKLGLEYVTLFDRDRRNWTKIAMKEIDRTSWWERFVLSYRQMTRLYGKDGSKEQ